MYAYSIPVYFLTVCLLLSPHSGNPLTSYMVLDLMGVRTYPKLHRDIVIGLLTNNK